MFDVNHFKAKNLQICEIDLEVKEKAKALRFQKKDPKTNAAIVRKCK